MIIMNRTIINHGRNEGMFMLKIKQKLTLASNAIGRGGIMYLVPKVLSEKNIDPLFNPVLWQSQVANGTQLLLPGEQKILVFS